MGQMNIGVRRLPAARRGADPLRPVVAIGEWPVARGVEDAVPRWSQPVSKVPSRTVASAPPKPPKPQLRAGQPTRVEIRCAGCGYGGVVSRVPGHCPMCGARAWEATTYVSPSSLAREREG